MFKIKDYIYLILCVSLICGSVKLLISSSKVSSAVNFTIKIIILCAVLSPLFKFVRVDLNDMNFFVINKKSEHSIVSEDPDLLWKLWTAQITSSDISDEIENKIFERFSIKSVVEVPFEENDGDIVFGKINITADCNEEKCRKIEEYVLLHYSLKSVCKKGEVND